MKKLLFSLSLIMISLFAYGQNNANIRAMIAGYNTKDTIKLPDFMKLTDILLNNKDYSIVNFTFSYSEGGYDYEIISNSNKITEEMKNAISGIKASDTKVRYIAFRNITVQSPQKNKIKTGDLIYALSTR